MTLLEIETLSKHFHGLIAVNRVSLNIEKGEIVGLIGPNGSGKTTFFNCITGHLRPEEGRVRKSGVDITGLPPHQIAALRIARTFQTIRTFHELTVLENLLVAAQQQQKDSFLGCLLRTRATRLLEERARHRAEDALNFVGLHELRSEPAEILSYGQRKLLSFATTLVSEPDIILLDEPAAAVNPTMINRMRERIIELNEQGITFLIVEHNMEFIMGLAERIVVLDYGNKIAEGIPSSIQANERVLEAYFGK